MLAEPPHGADGFPCCSRHCNCWPERQERNVPWNTPFGPLGGVFFRSSAPLCVAPFDFLPFDGGRTSRMPVPETPIRVRDMKA